MEKYCRPPLRKGEIVTVAQGFYENLQPEQSLARRMLFQEQLMSWEEATAFVRKIGPEISGMIRVTNPEELQIAIIEQQFVDATPAIQSWYLN